MIMTREGSFPCHMDIPNPSSVCWAEDSHKLMGVVRGHPKGIEGTCPAPVTLSTMIRNVCVQSFEWVEHALVILHIGMVPKKEVIKTIIDMLVDMLHFYLLI